VAPNPALVKVWTLYLIPVKEMSALALALRDSLHALRDKPQDFDGKDPAFVGQYSGSLSQ